MAASFSRSPAHLYVAADDRGRHKIGVTINPKLRGYQLGREIGGKVTLLHVDPLSSEADAVEQTAHWILAHAHGGGEWFWVSREEAFSALSQAKERVASGKLPTDRFTIITRGGLGPDLLARIDAVVGGERGRAQFIREAIEAELKRREPLEP